MRRYTFAVVAVLLFLLPGHRSVRADAARYTIENLGDKDGLLPTITGINAAGQVVGNVSGPAGSRAVRYTTGAGWEYLNGLDAATYSVANGINASGDVVGYRLVGSTYRAFRYTDAGGVQDIDPVPGGTMTFGFAINAAGDVVGYSDAPTGIVGFLSRPLQPTVALPDLGGGFTLACGINDAGQVVAASFNMLGVQHAIRIDPSVPAPVEIFGFDGAPANSAGCAIDADGTVGGQADGSGATRAYRFRGTTSGIPTNLDTFGSPQSNTEAIAAGTSVGWYTASANNVRALVNTEADGTHDLNDLVDDAADWVLSLAKGVNVNGSIAGEGTFQGKPAVFRLTKVPAAPSDTTPPTITALSASPSVIVPPNEAMVPVTIAVAAVDDQDPAPVCSISNVDRHGAPATSVNVTGPLSASVRASSRAIYTFAVTCADSTGNSVTQTTDVVVPADTTAPVFKSFTATPSVIAPPKGQTVTVTVAITATDDSGQTPVCKLANITGPGSAPADFNVTGPTTGTVRAIGGRTYKFNALCVDGSQNVAWSSVDVVVPPDTTAPVISRVSASPSTIWPPNGALVPVTVGVSATDDVDDAPSCALSSISSTSTTADDYAITGPLSAKLRAIGGRTYTLTVRCADTAGNSSFGSTPVLVAADTTAPVITAISATPSAIWPPNGKFVPVTVSVSATDDVDASPSCSLTSVTGAPLTEFIVTGAFTASVRANRNDDGSTRVYSLNVGCSDRAGNSSQASVLVVVSKDGQSPAKANGKK